MNCSPMRSSKYSRHQEVSVTVLPSSNTIWTIEHFDPKVRNKLLGTEIRVGDPILLKHCPTAQWLASTDVADINEFGKEF